MLRFQCPHCGNEIRTPDRNADKTGTCLRCKGPITAPMLSDNVWYPDGQPVRPREVHMQAPYQQQPSPMMSGFKAAFGGFFGFLLAAFVFIVVVMAYGQHKAEERRQQRELQRIAFPAQQIDR